MKRDRGPPDLAQEALTNLTAWVILLLVAAVLGLILKWIGVGPK